MGLEGFLLLHQHNLVHHSETKQTICTGCKKDLTIIHGILHHGEELQGIYSATFHPKQEQKIMDLMIGTILDGKKVSMAFHIVPTRDEIQMTIIKKEDAHSPDLDLFFNLIGKEEATKGGLQKEFFHLADHIVMDDPKIKAFLNS